MAHETLLIAFEGALVFGSVLGLAVFELVKLAREPDPPPADDFDTQPAESAE